MLLASIKILLEHRPNIGDAAGERAENKMKPMGGQSSREVREVGCRRDTRDIIGREWMDFQ